MRRIRPATIVSSFCAAVDGGRATIAAPFSAAGDGGFLHTDPKPNVRMPHTDIFGGQSSWVRKQLKDGERARKILFRNYCGRATQELADKEKLVNKRKFSFTPKEFHAVVYNLAIECGNNNVKFATVFTVFHEAIEHITLDDTDDKLGDATRNDRADKLAEIAEESDAIISNSFLTSLMIECVPEFEKRFREIIEKVRKKMIRDDKILATFELVANLMSKCEPEYEKVLCEALEKVRDKISQDDKGGNDNISKIENLAKLDMKVVDRQSFEEELDKFVTEKFIKTLRMVDVWILRFMAFEVIEKVAKKVGDENLHKMAEKELDTIAADMFLFTTVRVQMEMPYLKLSRLIGRLFLNKFRSIFLVGVQFICFIVYSWANLLNSTSFLLTAYKAILSFCFDFLFAYLVIVFLTY